MTDINLQELQERIDSADQKVRKASEEKIKAEENLKIAQKRKEEVLNKMKEHNVTPETIEETIQDLKQRIEKGLKTIEEQMPGTREQ